MESLSGKIVELRAPESEDVDKLYLWENDTTLWPYGSTRAPLSRHQLWSYVDSYDGDIFTSHQLRLMIVEKENRKTVGTIDLYDFDPRDGRVKIGVFIEPAHRGHGFAADSLEVIAHYARETLALHQLAALVCVDNTPSVQLFKNKGFKSNGCLRSWMRRGRHYVDVLVFQLML